MDVGYVGRMPEGTLTFDVVRTTAYYRWLLGEDGHDQLGNWLGAQEDVAAWMDAKGFGSEYDIHREALRMSTGLKDFPRAARTLADSVNISWGRAEMGSHHFSCVEDTDDAQAAMMAGID